MVEPPSVVQEWSILYKMAIVGKDNEKAEMYKNKIINTNKVSEATKKKYLKDMENFNKKNSEKDLTK